MLSLSAKAEDNKAPENPTANDILRAATEDRAVAAAARWQWASFNFLYGFITLRAEKIPNPPDGARAVLQVAL